MECAGVKNCSSHHATSLRIKRPAKESESTWLKRASVSFEYYATRRPYLFRGKPISFNLSHDKAGFSVNFDHVMSWEDENGRHVHGKIDPFRLSKCSLVFAVLECLQTESGSLTIQQAKNTSKNPEDAKKIRWAIICDGLPYKVILQDDLASAGSFSFITGYPLPKKD